MTCLPADTATIVLPRPRARAFPARARVTPEGAFAAGAGLYLLLCFGAFWVVRPSTLFYFTDYWEHRAIVAEVVRHGTRLVDPIYGEGAPSRQFTPWSLALGYLARWTGAGLDDAMALGALLVSVLFVAGVWSFGRAHYAHRWAPAVLLAALTCAWGVPAIIWTGFHSLRSQLHSNYYPAAFTFALTLIAWAWTIRLVRAARPGVGEGVRAAALAALVATCVVTHPLNAVFLLAGAGGFALLEPGGTPARRAGVLGVLLAGVAASTAWPYFNPLALAGPGVVRGKATFNDLPFFYDPLWVLPLLAPAAFALVAIRAQLLDPRARVPAIAAPLVFGAYVAGGIAGVSVSHRLLAFVALALQLMLVRVVLGAIDGRPPAPLGQVSRRGWRIAAGAGVGLVAVQLLFAAQQLVQPWALANVRDPARAVDADMARVRAALPAGARVMAWNSAALMLPAYGIKVVAFPRPMPLSPSDPARQADAERFFGAATPGCARRAILARWGATHVAWLPTELGARAGRGVRALGPVSAPVATWRIVRAPGPCPAG